MSIPREGSRDTGQGIIISLSPDVCKTPVGSALVPIPYTITAVQGDDANTVATVRMTGQRAHNMASLVTQCSGDAPGTGMGVVSGTVGSVCHPKSHSGSVRIRGAWAIRHNDEWWMNNRNTVGKLTYLRSQATFEPTNAVTLAQNPEREAPQPIQLADASGNWAQFLQPETAPARQPLPRPAPRPGPVRPPPNRIARPPARTFRFQVKPPPAPAGGAWKFADGAWRFTRRASPWALGLGLFFYQNSPNAWRDELWHNFGDPVEEGLLDLADRAVEEGADAADVGQWLRDEIARYRKEKAEAETSASPQVGVTPGNVEIEEQRRRDRPCIVQRYGSLACPTGEQAHHIVPDSTLRYGTRAEGEAGQKRIEGMPSFRDGMAICLTGNAADRTGGHGIAHGVTDPLIAAAGRAAAIPRTATVEQAKTAGIAGATAARPECAPEIAAAVELQYATIDSGRLVNAANRPATGAALDALMKGQ
jgi:Domain of unknown function (DUF4150)